MPVIKMKLKKHMISERTATVRITVQAFLENYIYTSLSSTKPCGFASLTEDV